MKRISELFRKGKTYYQNHLWCHFGTAIVASLMVILFVMITYTKNEYYKYLVNTTMTTEAALLDSVGKNIKTQMEDFVDIGASIAVDETFISEIESYMKEEEIKQDKDVVETLRVAAGSSNHIVGLALADESGVLHQYDKMEKNTIEKKLWTDSYRREVQSAFASVKEKSAEKILPRYTQLYYPTVRPDNKNSGLIHLAFPLKNHRFYKEIDYMLIVTFHNDGLVNLLSQLNQGGESYLQGYLEKGGDIFLHTKGMSYVGQKVQMYQGKTGITDLETSCGKYGWKVHAVIDENRIRSKVDAIYQEVVQLYIVAVVIVFGILLYVTKRTLRPVQLISASIQKVKDGDTREQLPIDGTNEIWQLAQEYNEMLKAIQEAKREVDRQHGEIVESLKMKRRAEREALESQINAHFICNTLNAINYEAIENGDLKVSILLKKLSNILRYTFDQKHQNVYIFQEISWVEQYLFLQKERMDDAFTYEVVFDSDYNEWPCRKLMLQPFVENSIIHGLKGREEGGWVKITGEGYREYLKIVIEDNGRGMDQERAQTIQEILEQPLLAKERAVGIGVSNVVMRMRMYYGEKFQIQMETEEGKGTKFTLILPMPELKGEREEGEKNNADFDS